MNKFLLLLWILLSTYIFAITPTPTPTTTPQGMTPPPYEPVCGTDPLIDCMAPGMTDECGKKTYYDQGQLETAGGEFLYEGICPTPTPKPSVEVICDTPSTVISNDRIKVSKKREPISFNILTSAHSINPLIRIDPFSVKFISEDSEHLFSYFHVTDKGTWYSNDGGAVFWPKEDFNGTSTIKYIVRNNCGIPSNPSTLTATIDTNETTTPMPVLDPMCIFLDFNSLLVVDDIRIITPDTQISVIDVLDNDTPYAVPASLRLVDENNNLVTKLTVKNQGRWLVDTNAGDILFLPNKNFRDKAEIKYVVNNQCNTTSGDNDKHYDFEHNIATIAVVMATPTPTPCPKAKDPVCGIENICTTEDEEITCKDTIPKQITYDNKCKLKKDNAIFIYNGICKKPTPTPTATPKPKPVIATEEPKPTTKSTQTVETNTTKKTSKVQSSDGSALGILSLFILMLLTLTIGRGEINRIG